MPDRPLVPPGAREASSPRIEVACLGELRRALEDPTFAAVCFEGPAGRGRSDLLYALSEELRGRCRLVYLRAAALPTGGFWMRVADALELASGYDARRRVLRLAGDLSRTGQALLLVVDDAPALPADTLHALLSTARLQPGLHVVLAHAAGERLAGPLPEDVAVVRSEESAGPEAGSATEEPATTTAPFVEPATPEPPPWSAAPRAPEPAGARGAAEASAAGLWQAREPGPAREPGLEDLSPAPSPPWEEPPIGPRLPRRRAARARRRERARRLAWGAAGLALGLGLAVAVDTDRWLPLAERLLVRLEPADAPLAPAPASSTGAPARPPEPDVAAAPERGASVAPPAERPADVAAVSPPPAADRVPSERVAAMESAPPGEAAASASTAPAGAAPRDSAPAAAVPRAEPEAAPPAPREPGPPPGAAAPRAEPVPAPPAAREPAADVAAAPPAAPAPAASPPAAPAPDESAAPPAPAEAPVRPSRRGPLALGSLAIASETPVRIEIDGQIFGPTPLSGVRLSRGEHRVLAHFPDGSVAQKTIVLDEDDLSVEFR